MWIPSSPRTICWKDCSYFIELAASSKNQMAFFLGLSGLMGVTQKSILYCASCHRRSFKLCIICVPAVTRLYKQPDRQWFRAREIFICLAWRCCWHLAGRGQEYCCTSYNAQDSPLQKYIWSKMSVWQWRNPWVTIFAPYKCVYRIIF